MGSGPAPRSDGSGAGATQSAPVSPRSAATGPMTSVAVCRMSAWGPSPLTAGATVPTSDPRGDDDGAPAATVRHTASSATPQRSTDRSDPVDRHARAMAVPGARRDRGPKREDQEHQHGGPAQPSRPRDAPRSGRTK